MFNVWEQGYDDEGEPCCWELIEEAIELDSDEDMIKCARRLEKKYGLSRIVFSEYDDVEPKDDSKKSLMKVYKDKDYFVGEVDWDWYNNQLAWGEDE